MSQIFDKLLASRPVNRAAARVLGGGVHYEPDKKIVQRHWTAPPALTPIAEHLGKAFFKDLTGVSFGRFKVMGYLGSKNGGWLVRCACGDYEARKSKAVQNPENYGDRCQKCLQLAFLKREQFYRQNPAAPQPDIRDM